jgi:hypothetical protein
MLTLNLMTIDRAVVHTIPSRGPDKAYVPPVGGTDLLHLAPAVNDIVVLRITKALGHHSHGVQADFVDTGNESVFERACSLMGCSDADFLVHAQAAADKLTKVQQSKALNPAKLITISGTVTANSHPFAAFIKAELQEALSETKQKGLTTLEILKNLFLTESNKLYKIGLVTRTVPGSGKKAGAHDPAQHAVYVYDHLMTALETRSAAFYFYNQFLGTEVSVTDRRLTRDFFEKTLHFIDTQGYAPNRRIALGEALRSELRNTRGQLSVAEFAKDHLHSPNDRAAYAAYMTKSGFPTHAITKDTEYVKTRLRKRQKVIFNTDVIISTPAEKASDLLKIKENNDGTTTVMVKGKVESNE